MTQVLSGEYFYSSDFKTLLEFLKPSRCYLRGNSNPFYSIEEFERDTGNFGVYGGNELIFSKSKKMRNLESKL